jgi:hypothetical protein
METLFEVRLEGRDEERIYLVAGSGEELWAQLHALLSKIEDVDAFDSLVLKRVDRLLFRQSLQNLMRFGPAAE